MMNKFCNFWLKNKIKTIKWSSRKLKTTPPGGLEPPTFRLTAERASQLRHGGDKKLYKAKFLFQNALFMWEMVIM